jgi:hypothetical protein
MTESNITELDMLGQHWREAKAAEDAARAERIRIEDQIIESVGVKEEGTLSRKTDWFKLSTTGKLTRSLDEKAFLALRDRIEDPPVNYKVTLDLKRLRDLETTNPDAYRLMLSCIETKPAKAAVRVELLRN